MSREVLEEFFEMAEEAIIPVRDTLRTRVKDEVRKKAKDM